MLGVKYIYGKGTIYVCVFENTFGCLEWLLLCFEMFAAKKRIYGLMKVYFYVKMLDEVCYILDN